MVANYDWFRELEIARRFDEPPPDPKDKRSQYEHDRSRIIHSVAFRRLQGKTQIFAPWWADYMRTRVTHTIEVAQIGRALGENAGLPGSLMEAVCLAHDLGHPPFGHTGEAVLNELMNPHGGFEGNAQTLRILTKLGRRTEEHPGLNLTRATLLGVLKYPFRRHDAHSKFVYTEDVQEYEGWLFEGTRHSFVRSPQEKPAEGTPRTIVCQLMDWADDIAYSAHDLEDGLASGFLVPATFREPKFVEYVWRNLRMAPIKTKPSHGRVRDILGELADSLGSWEPGRAQRRIREVARKYINRFVTSVEIRAREPVATSFDFSREVPEEVWEECQVLKAVTFEFVIRDERTTTFAYKGREIVRKIFEALRKNATPEAGRDRFELFPRYLREDLEEARDDQSALARLVCDYVASMTDGQAIHLYRRLFEPTGGSPFEPV